MIGKRIRRSGPLAAALGLLLAACANDPSLTDTIDARPAPDDMTTVGVCYNAGNTTREAVAALAREECPENAQNLQVWDQNSLGNACPLTKKNRVVFLCRP